MHKKSIFCTKSSPLKGLYVQSPAPGWDAKLVDNSYEPPAEGEPEWDLYGKDQFKAHIEISDLIDAAERRKRNGGNGDDSNND